MEKFEIEIFEPIEIFNCKPFNYETSLIEERRAISQFHELISSRNTKSTKDLISIHYGYMDNFLVNFSTLLIGKCMENNVSIQVIDSIIDFAISKSFWIKEIS